jgi:predicted dehydrogenase
MIPAILACTDAFELVAVASRSAATARDFAGRFGCEAVTGYDTIIARPDIDALYVPLPTGLHEEWVGKAITAGKHVYAEKSFASNAEQTASLVRAAVAQGVALMEGFMFQYHRQQLLVQEMLKRQELGAIRHFHACFGFPPLPAGDFRYDESLGGGVLMDAAGYPLRAVQLFFGDTLTVRCATLFRDPEHGNSLWGSAFLSDGQGLGASIAFGFDNAYQCRYEIWGARAKLIAERAYTAGPTFSPQLIVDGPAGRQVIDVAPDNHFVGAMLEFRHTILNEEKRNSHYAQLMSQSRALEDIRLLAQAAAPVRAAQEQAR